MTYVYLADISAEISIICFEVITGLCTEQPTFRLNNVIETKDNYEGLEDPEAD